MDLRTHYPFSLLRHGLIRSYPSLKESIDVDVAVVGAGITGALCAWHLQEAGYVCAVLDRGHVAMGSTAASTSLIQYEIDRPLVDLSERIGEARAVGAYRRCLEAVRDLKRLAGDLGEPDLFQDRCSLQYASSPADANGLKREYALRSRHGFRVDWLDRQRVRSDFGFRAPGALWTEEAGQLDVYRLSHLLLAHGHRKGSGVYDHTGVVRVTYGRNGVTLHTDGGHKVRARYVVFACGYESSEYFPGFPEERRCTYAFVSEPMGAAEHWKSNCLIWETADPYLYLRLTDDHRLLVGGADTGYLPLAQQVGRLPRKTAELKRKAGRLFPHLELTVDFAWAGTFTTTPDGLPYIGSLPRRPQAFIALGYGGNGITFSLIAAQQITRRIRGEKDPDAGLFSFPRR